MKGLTGSLLTTIWGFRGGLRGETTSEPGWSPRPSTLGVHLRDLTDLEGSVGAQEGQVVGPGDTKSRAVSGSGRRLHPAGTNSSVTSPCGVKRHRLSRTVEGPRPGVAPRLPPHRPAPTCDLSGRTRPGSCIVTSRVQQFLLLFLSYLHRRCKIHGKT